MKHERINHKCIFCGNPATVLYHGRYGNIFMREYCYENWDLKQEEAMNTPEHWEAIEGRIS